MALTAQQRCAQKISANVLKSTCLTKNFLSNLIFEPRTDAGSVLFSYFTCLHTTTFIFLSLFALVETISLKIWKRPSVLACEMFTSGCLPWLKNVAYLSSLMRRTTNLDISLVITSVNSVLLENCFVAKLLKLLPSEKLSWILLHVN